MIEAGYADDAAADDDYAGMRLHRPLRFVAPRVSVPPLKCVDITFVPDGEPGMCSKYLFRRRHILASRDARLRLRRCVSRHCNSETVR